MLQLVSIIWSFIRRTTIDRISRPDLVVFFGVVALELHPIRMVHLAVVILVGDFLDHPMMVGFVRQVAPVPMNVVNVTGPSF